ncbi:MAG: hypothetical protein RLZ83_1811 [Pseudomonadota bacterium]|jgi:DNA-binding MarR family transcriptional regulator
MPRTGTKKTTASKKTSPAKPALTGAWQAYARFLASRREARGDQTLPRLDAMEERVFEALAACWGEGRPVTVLQAMSMTGEASPTTVHRRLKSLRKKDLIRLHEDETDNRIKFIHATDAGMAYLDQLGVSMKEAIAQPASPEA